MKKSIFILSLLLSLLFYSCETKREKVEYDITFNDDDYIPVESLVNDIQFTELDNTVNDAFMDGIHSFAICDNKIYCFSNDKNGYVNVYSLDGKYLFKIEHVGRATNEWLNLISMFINPKEKMLILTDNETAKSLIYDLNGNYIRTIQLEYFDRCEVAYDNGFYYSEVQLVTNGDVRSSDNEYKVNVYDSNLKLAGRKIPYKYNDSNLFEDEYNRFVWGENHLLFTYLRDETVYSLENGEAKPYISYTYNGNKPFYDESEINDAVNKGYWFGGDDKTYYCGFVLETDKYIYRRLGWNDGMDVIYDKKSGKAITTQFLFGKQGEKHLSDKIMYPAPVYVKGDRFYSVLPIDYFELPELYWKKYMPKQLEKYARKAAAGKCNQVIVSYKISL